MPKDRPAGMYRRGGAEKSYKDDDGVIYIGLGCGRAGPLDLPSTVSYKALHKMHVQALIERKDTREHCNWGPLLKALVGSGRTIKKCTLKPARMKAL